MTLTAKYDRVTAIYTKDKNSIRLYPNPITDGVLYIESDTPINEVSIFDISGNVVLYKSAVNTINDIDVSKLKNGFYLIRIAGRVYKIIKD